MADKTITGYTYEVWDMESKMWCISSLNYTTGEALAEYLCAIPRLNNIRFVKREISIEKLKKNPNMPFISDYIREAIGMLKIDDKDRYKKF
jgi:hypothetical protein